MRTILLILGLCALTATTSLLTPGCKSSPTAAQVGSDVESAAYDCTSAQAAALTSEFGPVVTSAIQAAKDQNTGEINTSSLSGFFGTLLADGWCVVKNVVADLSNQTQGIGSGSAVTGLGSSVVVAPSMKLHPAAANKLAADIATLEASKFPGKTFKMKH
jgi:hypothetical protein